MADPFDDAALRDAAATVWKEAGDQGPEGWKAVAGVIKNRADQSGQSLSQVVRAPYQFEPWQTKRKEMEAFGPSHPDYKKIVDTIRPVLAGEAADPTGGADHFYAPKLIKPPSWAQGRDDYADIGGHRFYKLGYRAGSGVPGTTNAGFFSRPNPPPAGRPMADDTTVNPYEVDTTGYVSPDVIKARLARLNQAYRYGSGIEPKNAFSGLFSGLIMGQSQRGQLAQEEQLLKNDAVAEAALKKLGAIDEANATPAQKMRAAAVQAPPQAGLGPNAAGAAPSGVTAVGAGAGGPTPVSLPGVAIGNMPPGSAPPPAGLPAIAGATPGVLAQGLLGGMAPPGAPGAPTAPSLEGQRPAFETPPDVLESQRQRQLRQAYYRMASMEGTPAAKLALSELEFDQKKRLAYGIAAQEAQLKKQLAREEQYLVIKQQVARAILGKQMTLEEGQQYLNNVMPEFMRTPGGGVSSATAFQSRGVPSPAGPAGPIQAAVPGTSAPSGTTSAAVPGAGIPANAGIRLSQHAQDLQEQIRIATATGDFKGAERLEKQLENDASYMAMKAQTHELGKAAGAAQADLPRQSDNFQRLITQVDDVLKHPNLSMATGTLMGHPWYPTFAGETKDVEAKIKQTGGSAFLQAYNSLRGGGAISDVEGGKATYSLQRLAETRVGTERYKEALTDFKLEVYNLYNVARAKAGQPPVPIPADLLAKKVEMPGEEKTPTPTGNTRVAGETPAGAIATATPPSPQFTAATEAAGIPPKIAATLQEGSQVKNKRTGQTFFRSGDELVSEEEFYKRSRAETQRVSPTAPVLPNALSNFNEQGFKQGPGWSAQQPLLSKNTDPNKIEVGQFIKLDNGKLVQRIAKTNDPTSDYKIITQ